MTNNLCINKWSRCGFLLFLNSGLASVTQEYSKPSNVDKTSNVLTITKVAHS